MQGPTLADVRHAAVLSSPIEGRHLRHHALAVDALTRYLAGIDWTRDAAEHCADIWVDLKKKGQPIGPNYLMIAAHARSLGAVLRKMLLHRY